MPVRNGQQNQHRWWGTLTIDQNTEVIDCPLMPGVRCVFVKTSKDAHFIGEGTYTEKVRVFNSKSEAENAVLQEVVGATQGQIESISADLNSCDFPSYLPIVEILGIDDVMTTPLAKVLNTETLARFIDPDWLTDNAERIGRADIELGLQLPELPKDACQSN